MIDPSLFVEEDDEALEELKSAEKNFDEVFSNRSLSDRDGSEVKEISEAH